MAIYKHSNLNAFGASELLMRNLTLNWPRCGGRYAGPGGTARERSRKECPALCTHASRDV